MLRNFLKNRKAQNTMEYAMLIALVIAGAVAMGTYVQRGNQARMKDGVEYMANITSCSTMGLGNDEQYEPYYLNSDYKSDTQSVQKKRLGNGLVGADSDSNEARTGGQSSNYIASDMTGQ